MAGSREWAAGRASGRRCEEVVSFVEQRQVEMLGGCIDEAAAEIQARLVTTFPTLLKSSYRFLCNRFVQRNYHRAERGQKL